MHLGALARGRLSSQIPPFRSRSLYRPSEDLESLRQWLGQQHTHVDPQTYYHLLHSCGRLKALAEGKRLHVLIRDKGLHSDVAMANCILNMYGKCHSVQDARDVFDNIVDGNEVSWTSMIAIYAKRGHSRDAFDVFQRMQLVPFLCPNEVTFISVLIACNHSSFFTECHLIFTLIVFHKYECDLSVSNALVTAYTKCENVKDAHRVFGKMAVKNVVSWTAMIKAFSELNDGKAFEIFRQMLAEGVKTNKVTLLTLLSVCSNSQSLEDAKRFHVVIIETGGILDVVLGGALVVTYGQCGSVESALRVFNLLRQRNVITWNGMISVFAHSGLRIQAYQLFEKMQQEGIEPDNVSFTIVLSQCMNLENLIEGRIVHTCGVQVGIDSEEVVGCALIEMYGKCGNLTDAHTHFNRLEKQSVLLWSFLIVSHAKEGHLLEVLTLFCQMQVEGVLPNEVTFSSLLSAFGEPPIIAYGKVIHLQIRERISKINDVIGSSLVSMYSRCGDLKASQKVFKSLGNYKSVVMWNALLSAYNHHGQGKECLEILKLMLLEGVLPDGISFSSILAMCADVGLYKEGESLYGYAVECELEANIIVDSAIINMYGKCGRLQDALWMFWRAPARELIAWNSILAAYALHGQFEDMLFYYEQMRGADVKPSEVTFAVMLEGCSIFEEGKIIHHLIIQNQFEPMPIVCNALISMYGDCGTLQTAINVFNRFSKRNSISWNTMIGLHARYLHFQEVFRLFHEVPHGIIKLDEVSIMHTVSACTSLAALEEGKLIYGYAIEMGVHQDALLQSALVSMFSKCSQVRDAWNVFGGMHGHDVVSCTTMIVAFVQCGHIKGALIIFQLMLEKGIEPNEISFVSILSASSHAGLVEAGCNFFLSMINPYGIIPTLRHFSCLLDIFSRSGQLHIAEDLINRIPVQPISAMWITLISACRADCDVERGQQLASCLFQLKQPCDAAAYSLLSTLYATIDVFSCNNPGTFSEELNLDASAGDEQDEDSSLFLGGHIGIPGCDSTGSQA